MYTQRLRLIERGLLQISVESARIHYTLIKLPINLIVRERFEDT